MPEPHKSDVYSFWRWEYLRRNTRYQKHYHAMEEFILGILIRPMWPMDTCGSGGTTLNKINGFVQRFKVLPFPYDDGPGVEELLEMAASGTYDFSRSNLTLIVNYQTDIYSMRPNVKNFDADKCKAEFDILLKWEDIKNGYSKTRHRELSEAIGERQMLDIGSPNFHAKSKSAQVGRALGLYLRDKIDGEGMQPKEVQRELELRGYGRSPSTCSERLAHARACIEARDVLPFGSKE